MTGYRGRFAPSPTGRLHLGSMACAMATYLDARSHSGTWLVRIEDIDPFRDIPGIDRDILATLAAFGMVSDEPVVYQSQRTDLYRQALDLLRHSALAYGCSCTRRVLLETNRANGRRSDYYPGNCRLGTNGLPARSWRFLTQNSGNVSFEDRLLGVISQNVENEIGDFILFRADGCWTYQLAVTVDDADQGITDVVRGADLADNTPRQILLQRALGVATPRYMHIPLVTNEAGEKLSKQTLAEPVRSDTPLSVLETLWRVHYRMPAIGAQSLAVFWKEATVLWKERLAT